LEKLREVLFNLKEFVVSDHHGADDGVMATIMVRMFPTCGKSGLERRLLDEWRR
jgi:hypothetical protein